MSSPPTKLEMRTAMATDMPQIVALYAHLSPEDTPCPLPVAQENFAQFQRLAPSAVFVGEQNDMLVTSCVLVIVPNLSRGGRPYGLIENVVTHKAFRNRGFGKHILDTACDHAWAHGCYKVMLMTGSQRPSTLRVYENAGFAQTKTGYQKRAVGF